MANTTSLKFSNLLGQSWNEVKSLEKRIQNILHDNNIDDDDDENGDAEFIENKIKQLINRHYDSLKLIDQKKRIEFWNELNTQLKRLPRRCLTAEVESQMTLLERVCYFDFTQRSLSFAFEGIHHMDILTGCEQKLLELIDKMRKDYGLINVLNSQYESIRNQRRKIILVVASGLKAGKSSFVNYLLESDVCPVGISETTARLTKIIYGQQKLVKLESINGELKEQYEIHSDEQLNEVTKKLIALKGASREEELCKDIVTIQLNRKDLENIEIWDIPGFDENPFLNSIVEDILKETNIFFILTSITEAVRETIVNLFQSCSEKHKRPPQVCFIVTKIDQVTKNPKVETTLDNELDHVFHRIQDRFQVQLGDDWKSSPCFIPLCADPKYSLKDFLDSHEQFTHKLTQFFTYAVRHNMVCRLGHLIDMIHELLDYDDLDRSIQRDEKLSNILTTYHTELYAQMEKELKEPFIQIHKAVANTISAVIQPGNDDTVRQVLVNEIEKELLMYREQIERAFSKCLKELYLKLERHPALTAVMRSLEERKFYGDPYQAVIGQYKNREDSLLRSAIFCHAIPALEPLVKKYFGIYLFKVDEIDRRKGPTSSLLKAFHFAKFTFSYLLRVIFKHSEVKMEKALMNQRESLIGQAQATAESSVETILQGLIEDISNNIQQTLCEQLNSISEDIRRRKVKLSEQKKTSEARHIAGFLKENNPAIVQLYLNLLDKTNCFEYPRCEINRGTVLGHSNFPVFPGELGKTDRTYSAKIAAKRVPLKNFTWQEVRYMNELKHENILLYYGVRKSEGAEDSYDILMQHLDADLTKYIDYASQKGKVNDKFMDNIFMQITSGLGYLHEQGIIHRDIKPQNVLVLLKKEQPPVFVIADFGFVHRVPISIKGTAGFLAPELLAQNADINFITAKVDMFALGSTIRQTIKGSRIDTNGKYVQFWARISQQCLSDDSWERPTCQEILEEHSHLIN